MNGSDYFDAQPDGRGGYSGPRLQGTLFVPAGMGIAFSDGSGGLWQMRLARNPDGTIFIGDDSKPTIELIQVTL